jgi:hypothetical protein
MHLLNNIVIYWFIVSIIMLALLFIIRNALNKNGHKIKFYQVNKVSNFFLLVKLIKTIPDSLEKRRLIILRNLTLATMIVYLCLCILFFASYLSDF